MRALVTGSAGFVGRHMVAELEMRGWDVLGVDVNDAHPDGALDLFRLGRHVFDLVVHAAARSPHRAAIDGQPSIMPYNVMLDAAMFDWAVRTGQRRVLYLSSSAVYPVGLQDGRWNAARPQMAEQDVIDGVPDVVAGQLGGAGLLPDASYGWTKLTGERMAAAAAGAGLAVHVVRPFSGYGEDQGEDWPFGAFVARACRREDPFTIWGTGQQVRDWIHIDDVVAGALSVVEADVREPVNLCTGAGTSMRDLATMVCDAAGYRPEFATKPDAPSGVAYRVGDPARFHEIYRPRVTLAEGVRRAVASVPSASV